MQQTREKDRFKILFYLYETKSIISYYMEFQENKKKILSEDEVIAKESVTKHIQ